MSVRNAHDPAHERVFLFGIRHHGPGSARSLRTALRQLKPDALLIEGPPEADSLLPLAVHEEMQPPVALLIYAAKEPGLAAYYPFTHYSPEWQAIRYALENQISVRWMDLPQSIQMAWDADFDFQQPPAESQPAQPDAAPEAAPFAVDSADPLRLLAAAAGYSESEQWWEHLVEQHRGGDGALFDAILTAMLALREAAPPETNPIAIRREAAMRQNIRRALDEGYRRIAVVCGAWHTPALLDLSAAKADAALLKGLPKLETRATWIPWSNARLTRQSGYGAGIDAPGWYQHLWSSENQITARWMIRAARLLRQEDLDISSAHVIDAVRLAETLAALRNHPLPGLAELNDAALTVFCAGSAAPMRLIETQLLIGDTLGSVPAETPMAPLQQDFEKELRRLKLKPEAVEKLLDLDLRKPTDLERSYLLHRLALLDVPWGSAADAALQTTAQGRKGTFHEIWRLKWQPEYTVRLIEAGRWGNTLAAAASACICEAAREAQSLETLTGWIENVLLAQLPEAIQVVMEQIQRQAALAAETPRLMQALPPLAEVLRYGNVRNTDAAMLKTVIDGIAARIWIGLPTACAGLNDEAAAEMFLRMTQLEDAIERLDTAEYRAAWQKALMQVVNWPGAAGLLAGRACRILLDSSAFSQEEAARQFGLALSPANDALWSSAWVEGFLHSSGQLLIHDEKLFDLLDQWVCHLPGELFTQLLPLLRRTFATFSAPERRGIGEQVQRSRQRSEDPAHSDQFDTDRANAVLPLVAQLLGIVPSTAHSSVSAPKENPHVLY